MAPPHPCPFYGDGINPWQVCLRSEDFVKKILHVPPRAVGGGLVLAKATETVPLG